MAELPPGERIALTAGGEIDRVRVCLRVSSDQLEPEAVSLVLGVSPTFAARRGDRRSTRGGESVQRTGVWYVDFTGAPEEWTLGEAIAALLNRLPPEQAVWDVLAEQHYLEIYCGLHLSEWNRGAELAPALLRRLADQHLALSFDIYYEGADHAAS
jgi:hypothetical protein